MQPITAHMIVKNEDQWVWFAIQSVLPFIDYFFITDTGSSDQTIAIIKSIKSPKISFNQIVSQTQLDITQVRQAHIDQTKTDWIWIIDGDEAYPQRLCQEILQKISGSPPCILVKRFDLLGDVYHAQAETVGEYVMNGFRGHISNRLLNQKKLGGLIYQGDYPLEGFFDGSGKNLLDYPKQSFQLTDNRYWHAGYLKRSSLGSNLAHTFNRSKYKVEMGHLITQDLPEVFTLNRPSLVSDPLEHRSLGYEIKASIMTPIKKLKRHIFK